MKFPSVVCNYPFFLVSKLTRLAGSNKKFLHQAVHSHHIIRYIAQFWISHLRQSSFVSADSEISLTTEFKEIFPEANLFTMLKWSLLQGHHVVTELVKLHEWSLRVKSACFGEKHQTVMQKPIILGSMHRDQSEMSKASEYFYRALNIGQTILFKFSPIVVFCTHMVLLCTETITFTKRTTVMKYREEMIRIMTQICKRQHGPHSTLR